MKRMGLARGLLALLLLPGVSLALGLGDVHLNSPLNAPLDAEIELVNTTPEDLATLEAKLASKETFERYGLDWPQFMAGVTVTRDRSANGAHVLRIKSTETVTEPFLTLLIEATWGRGRLVREYTVLLDPPVFAPNSVQSAPVATPSTGASPSTGQIDRPAPEGAPSPAAPSMAGGGDSYEVQRGDSLSAIARRLSANTGARSDQLMVSIYRGNPGAFEGDMNRLRAGAVLRIPSGDEVAAVSPSEASGEVRRLAGSWAASSGAAGSGRLRLVPPSESSASAGTSAADAAEMSNLRERVTDLEGQLNESKRMLELRNTELANLQAKLAASQQSAQAAQQPATPPPAEPTPPEQTAQVTPETAQPEPTPPETAVGPPESTPPEQPAATPAETPETTPVASAEEGAGEEGIVAKLLSYWWVLAALVVLGLLAVVAKSRRKKKTAEFEDNLGRLAEQGGDRLAEPAPSDTGRMRAPQSSVPDDILVEESGTHRALQETQDIPLSASNVRTDETISSETAVNLDQGDPLAEADFHMAYGLYDQAADLVRIAIQREPDRRDLKLKLLEVFFVWGNREQFLTLAHELGESRHQAAGGEWDKIVIMGKQIAPEDPLFAEGGGGGAVGVDLNLDAGGSGRVDFDPFDVSQRMDVTGGGTPDPIDLDLGNALRDPDSTGESAALPNSPASNQTTREMTVKMTPAGSEAPTVEQPALRPLDEPTIREKVEGAMRRKLSSDQTAELALDDLGLDLGSLEQTDSQIGLKPLGGMPRGNEANAPTMVAGLDENSQRLLAAAAARSGANGSDDALSEHGASGTWFLTERELGGDVDLTKGRSIDPNSTASMAKFEMPEEGFDVSSTSRLAALDRANLDFPVEPTQQQPAMGGRGNIDLDLGAASGNYELPGSATEELAIPDLEPVTLSEVGTKLDLARAYVDMGDPDGARNILNEVLSEGSASQKQEAQRLIESLPG
jgi:pilus assembly protein FimV